MINLRDLVLKFSLEEKRKFHLYLKTKNKRKDTKNEELFKLLLTPGLSSKDICQKLYNTSNTGAYHALRKRFLESIIDFTANISLQEANSSEMQVIKYILASKSFLINKQYQLAYKILDKAEITAKTNDMFALLNEIYHTKIEYAYANPKFNLETTIAKFKANQKTILIEDELNLVYAKIKKTLNTITYEGAIVDFETIVKNTLIEHEININDALSFKSLYQLVGIVSFSAFINKDYLKIEPFLVHSYQAIIEKKNHKKQLYYHIQILYAIANAHFRNKKFQKSLEYLKSMRSQMEINKSEYFNTFKLKYNLLLALNLNYSNQQTKAIHTLEPLIKEQHEDIESLLDIHLSLIMFYFQKGDLKKVQSIFSKFYHTDSWYTQKAGKEWVIKKNLVEILLHIELQNINLVESRLLSFKRTYYAYLKNIQQHRVISYLTCIETYYKHPEIVTKEAFKEKIENTFDWKATHEEDIFVMSFYSWLKSKMNKSDLFETTLNLIKQAQIELQNSKPTPKT